MQDICL